MSRRTSAAAEAASTQASEAARVLQQRSQESRNEAKSEPVAQERTEPMIPEGRLEKLRNNNPRDRVMDEIVASRGPKEPEATAAAEKSKEEPKAEAQAVEKPATEQAQPETVPAEAPKTVKVKVDGEEFDAPAEDVEAAGGVRSYQMQRASENRLKKSNEALAEARRAQSEITQLATAMIAQRGSQQPAKAQESDQQFIASKMDIIRFGTPEESAAAWLEIQQRAQPKAVDQYSIVQQATSQIRHDDATRAFDRDFPDVATNPIRLKAVLALRQERLEKHKIERPNQPIDWDSFYRTIGNEVRSAFGGSSQAAATPAATSGNSSPASEKEARKASIVNLPAAAAKAEAPKEDKPETREETLRGMRKARGLPVD
jgi:hypothetical protein